MWHCGGIVHEDNVVVESTVPWVEGNESSTINIGQYR